MDTRSEAQRRADEYRMNKRRQFINDIWMGIAIGIGCVLVVALAAGAYMAYELWSAAHDVLP